MKNKKSPNDSGEIKKKKKTQLPIVKEKKYIRERFLRKRARKNIEQITKIFFVNYNKKNHQKIIIIIIRNKKVKEKRLKVQQLLQRFRLLAEYQ